MFVLHRLVIRVFSFQCYFPVRARTQFVQPCVTTCPSATFTSHIHEVSREFRGGRHPSTCQSKEIAAALQFFFLVSNVAIPSGVPWRTCWSPPASTTSVDSGVKRFFPKTALYACSNWIPMQPRTPSSGLTDRRLGSFNGSNT